MANIVAYPTDVDFQEDEVTDINIGENEQTTRIDEEETGEITFDTESGSITPVYIKDYQLDSFGQHESLHDDCGNREVRNGGATGFQITMKGIMTLDQVRSAREIGFGEGTVVTVNITPWVETYTVDNFKIDKPNDLNKWYSTNYPDGVEAYKFTLQTRDPTSNNP